LPICALLVAHCQSAELLATIDQALDAVPETVEGAIERSLVTCILLVRDGDLDAMLAGIAPNAPAAVAFVPDDAVRATLGTAWPAPLDGTGLHELFKDHGLVSLPRGEDDGHPLAAPFSAQ